jgi:hypothetical protein
MMPTNPKAGANPKTGAKPGSPNQIDENERKSLLRLTQDEEKRASAVSRHFQTIHKMLGASNLGKKEYDAMMRETDTILKDLDALHKQVDNFRRSAGRMFKH